MTLLRIVVAIIILYLAGCALMRIEGSGNVLTETRDVENFENVEVCCGMTLVLTQGNETSLTVEAEDNIMDKIESVVSDNTLNVRFRQGLGALSLMPQRPVVVKVQMVKVSKIAISVDGILEAKRIEGDQVTIELSGGSSGTVDTLLAESMALLVSGGGTMIVKNITAGKVVVEAHGGSRVLLTAGTITEQSVNASGGSLYEANAAQSRVATITANGGSLLDVAVSESLRASANGGSRITYYGNPTVEPSTTGGGEVRSASQ